MTQDFDTGELLNGRRQLLGRRGNFLALRLGLILAQSVGHGGQTISGQPALIKRAPLLGD